MLLRLGTVVALLLALLALAVTPARAADPAALSLTTTGGYADEAAPLAVALLAADGTPLVGASVVVERRVGGAWTALATVVTDEAGAATTSTPRSRTAADNVFRASYAGDGTHDPAAVTATSRLARRTGVVTVGGPVKVVDERTTTVKVVSRTSTGTPVSGWVRVERSASGQAWKTFRTVRTDDRGRASFVVRPRTDTRWRAVTKASDWVTGDRSPAHRVDNLPPGSPVRLPRGAPSPRVKVPAQPRATTRGAHPVVTRIPNGVWASMVGRSWHTGCPVGREGLRLLRVNYWGYDGYRYRGEVVAATSAIDNMARALTAMYDGRFPIRSMYRVDRFGWSGRLNGADDYRSMAAGNTSAFNCRDVVNRPGVRSPHASGRALDVNTWENPYRSATGLVPNSWWQGHSHPRVAWRSRSHPVVRLFLRAGFRWTYATGDSQHFDAVGSNGKVAVPSARACGGFVCH
ncbi:M15 family metallopeptidase [Nocardioides sp.]|uniref:M15 family metallopeptidase n=1 Tax=Nocardioides sp. TaxID=35761 RepID=UPI002716DA69|nr:M15 family metallopeptidase [Nocardioides sp.]MDO9457754.1 M15 family metallopeptidase [Nocardioides sp.]